LQKKVILLLVLALTLTAVPAMGAYEFEQLPNGKFSVTFTYETAAKEVYLVGNFNDWDTKNPENLMEKNEDGIFEKTLELAKGNYEYKFYADGQYKSDPDNPETIGDYGNSLLSITAGGIKGEVGLKGEMNNEIIAVKDQPIAFNNNIKLKLEGTLQEEVDEEKVDRIDYMAEFTAENNMKDVEDPESYLEFPSIDEIHINKMYATLLQKYANTSLQVNMVDDTDSFDYLKLVDAQTSKDDRDNYNINDAGDSLRIKITPGSGFSEDYDFHLNFTEYTYDITNAKKTRKYFGNLNFQKDFRHSVTGKVKGKAGVTGLVYQPVVLGEIKDLTGAAAVFGEYELFDNFTLRGEYAMVPTGDISERVTGAYDYDDENWLFIFCVDDYPDIADIKDPYTIEEVHVVGDFKAGAAAWTPADKTFAMSEEVPGSGLWKITIPKENIDEGKGFKFMFDSDDWDPYGQHCGEELGGGDNLIVGQTSEDIPIKHDGQAYMAEANYRIFDAKRSFRVGKEAYKFDITAGYKGLVDGAYLPVAADELFDEKDSGVHDIYLKTYYYPMDNDLKLTLDGNYKMYYEETDKTGYGATVGFDFPQPVSFIDYVKGNIERYDIRDGWEFTESILKDNKVTEYNRVFFEGKTKPVGPLNYVLTSVKYTNKIGDFDVVDLFGEVELNIPVEQIAYVKGNVDYKLGDKFDDDEQRLPRFFVEGKVHHLPYIQDYMTHILVNYEYDKGGIIDKSWYKDDDNDWDQKIYAETKFVLPQLEGFELKVSGETQRLEDWVYDETPDNLDKDEQYYHADSKSFIDWYTLVTVSAGYEFSFGLRTDLSLIFDLNHQEISQYEDNALKLELSQPLNNYSTLKAAYNAKHPDHSSKECISLKLETLF
jgi:hypothetical protein